MLKSRVIQNVNCRDCAVNYLCLPGRLGAKEIDLINNIISKIKFVNRGEYIFHAKDSMINVYAIYSGALKSAWIDKNGIERIENFYLTGDIIGLESIQNREYLFSAIALEDAQLCVIPIDLLFDLMHRSRAVLERVLAIACYKMQNDQHICITSNANQRVADFILNILYRLQERKIDQAHIDFPISQVDMANFLGLAPETINRILKNLQKEKIIVVENKTIHVLDITQLKKLSTPIPYSEQR